MDNNTEEWIEPPEEVLEMKIDLVEDTTKASGSALSVDAEEIGHVSHVTIADDRREVLLKLV